MIEKPSAQLAAGLEAEVSRTIAGRAPSVEGRDIRKSFGKAGSSLEVEVLHGVSLTVANGEMVSIVGPSGSGKSTLLYCLAGLESVSSGAVVIAGTELSRLRRSKAAKFRRGRIGFVFQTYNLIPSLTVAQNVALPARLAHRGVSASGVLEVLDRVGLADRGSALPGELSGGQQQRVAVARALYAKPEVLFADEPTGALDTRAGQLVLELIREVADAGSAVVMVTHDLAAAAQADRSLVLRDGRLHQELLEPTAEQLFKAVQAAI